MKPGYYWARVKANISFSPKPEPMEVGSSGNVYSIANEDFYREDELEFFGPCKPPGIRVSRIQAPLRTPVDKTKLVSWTVLCPAVKSRNVDTIEPWQWVVHAASYDDAREAFRKTFELKRVPIGATFTRIDK